MRGRIVQQYLVCLCVALTAWACDSTPTTPTTTTVTTVTTTFTGVLTLNGAATFTFAASTAGTITLTLTSEGPDATLPIGLSLGTWNGTACAAQLSNDQAFQGAVVTGVVSGASTLCVRVFDSHGTVVAPTTFQVDVLHP